LVVTSLDDCLLSTTLETVSGVVVASFFVDDGTDDETDAEVAAVDATGGTILDDTFDYVVGAA